MRSSHDNFSIVELRTSQSNDNAGQSPAYQAQSYLDRVAGQFIVRLKFISKWERLLGLDCKTNV